MFSAKQYFTGFLNRFIRKIIDLMFVIIFLGSGKSTLINYIKMAMCQLIDLFPDIYNKKINKNDQVIKMTSDITLNLVDSK